MRKPEFVQKVAAVLRTGDAWRRYSKWANRIAWPAGDAGKPANGTRNALRAFFEERREGRGIWKWDHYFDIYDRHFSRFQNTEVHVLEVGIYSGGSLDMWQYYFGEQCHVYGVDLEPECRAYERERVSVLIGDQADRSFWARVKQQVPKLDIVIDDGGHLPNQQIVTLEELLPHLQPGGVFLCEDVHGTLNAFASYVHRVAHELNAMESPLTNLDDNERRTVCKTTALQSAIASVHLYPFVAVLEKSSAPVCELVAPKHGTEWQPFLA